MYLSQHRKNVCLSIPCRALSPIYSRFLQQIRHFPLSLPFELKQQIAKRGIPIFQFNMLIADRCCHAFNWSPILFVAQVHWCNFEVQRGGSRVKLVQITSAPPPSPKFGQLFLAPMCQKIWAGVSPSLPIPKLTQYIQFVKVDKKLEQGPCSFVQNPKYQLLFLVKPSLKQIIS